MPERLRPEARVGAVVVAPLSGRHRLGVIVGTDEADEHRATEELAAIPAGLSLAPDMIEVSRRISATAAVPLPVVLRVALPPGLDTGRYRVTDPLPGWSWGPDETVSRTTLANTLGENGLRAAEAAGRVELAPAARRRPDVEWAIATDGPGPDLGRAPSQRRLLRVLEDHGGTMRTSALLSETGAGRGSLRGLVAKGAVELRRGPEPPPIFAGRNGSGRRVEPFRRAVGRVVGRGGNWLWRVAARDQVDVAVALASATVKSGGRALILAPEIELVERLSSRVREALPPERTVASYHSGLGRDRAAVYEAARDGLVDVVIGTRAAALLPLPGLGSIGVVDEPNEAHRAPPGFEGLPLPAGEIAAERGLVQGAGVLLLSPTPSLRSYSKTLGPKPTVSELPSRVGDRWPIVRIVDVRGTGAALSSTLLDACRRAEASGRRVGIVANRRGYAAAVCCARCGAVRTCRDCDVPLSLVGEDGPLVCPRCGSLEKPGPCETCGSGRTLPTGFALDRAREGVSRALGSPVGLLSADERVLQDAPVVVGTARSILAEQWDAVLVPDADGFLLGGGIGATERAFRLLFGAAEAARELLLVQTRMPEHYGLRAAVRGDYPAFAAAELPRLRALGYPPFAHLAAVTFEGPEDLVRRAVESGVRSSVESGVTVSAPVPLPRTGGSRPWRVLLRSPDRSQVARAGARAARVAARSRGLTARVDVDPEEV